MTAAAVPTRRSPRRCALSSTPVPCRKGNRHDATCPGEEINRSDGSVRPLHIQWYDGQTYPADKVVDVRRSSARRVGGDGICYTVMIGSRTTYLYYEDPHWFVEEIVVDGPAA